MPDGDAKARKPLATAAAFRAVVQQTSPSRFMQPKDYLTEVYRTLKLEFKGYSYNHYSADSGLGETNVMHHLAHGKRPLTLKTARKIGEAFGLKNNERLYFFAMVEHAACRDTAQRDEIFARMMRLKSDLVPTDLDRGQLAFYQQWYNLVVLEALRLPDAQDDPNWLADRLMPRVPPSRVARTLELLVELGYAHHDPQLGRLVPSQALATTGPEVYGMAIANLQQKMLDLAKDSLLLFDHTERDFSTLTFAVSNTTRDIVKQEIIAFRQRLRERLRTEDGQPPTDARDIVQLNLQLFPLFRHKKGETR